MVYKYMNYLSFTNITSDYLNPCVPISIFSSFFVLQEQKRPAKKPALNIRKEKSFNSVETDHSTGEASGCESGQIS